MINTRNNLTNDFGSVITKVFSSFIVGAVLGVRNDVVLCVAIFFLGFVRFIPLVVSFHDLFIVRV